MTITSIADQNALPHRKRSFAPVVNDQVRVLILGSLPGEQSLQVQQYYGNRQNRFWTLMSDVIAVDLTALPYTARLQALLANRIGLWDVVAEAERRGSLDSNIRSRADNDLPALASSMPQLAAIAFNGATAARIGVKALGPLAERYRIVKLPSSSPAHTLAYAEKLAVWKQLRDCIAV